MSTHSKNAAATTIIYIANTCPNISSNNKEFIKIINVTERSIISIEINIKIIFFLFNTNPKIPIKNKENPINITIFIKNLSKYY